MPGPRSPGTVFADCESRFPQLLAKSVFPSIGIAGGLLLPKRKSLENVDSQEIHVVAPTGFEPVTLRV